MATWHIPLCGFDDPFEELLDFTFPPRTYRRLAYDWPRYILPQRHGEERDSWGPYALQSLSGSRQSVDDDDGFKVQLSVKHYKPDEINLKVEGQTLILQGKHEHQSEHGFEKSEFHRQYTLPEDVDPKTLSSRLAPDGVLCIQASKFPKSLSSVSQELPKDNSNFKLAFDVAGYKPEEISVKVVGRNLIVCGEAKNEKGDGDDKFVYHKQFTRHMTIPDNVDVSALSTRYSKEGKVIVEAPRLGLPVLAEKHLELKMDTEDEKNEADTNDSH